jgi:DNA-binding MarR family transcriptional regulator
MHATAASTQALADLLHAFWAHVMRVSGPGFLQELDDHQLSLTQLKALHVLQARGEVSVKQLGECLHLSLPASSRAVDGLVNRGLVERFECAADRRSRLVRLADPGRGVLERVTQARLAGFGQFVETLEDADRDALARALVPIVERLSP